MPWDDPEAAWDTFDVAVIRSTWDYSTRRTEFLDWAPTTFLMPGDDVVLPPDTELVVKPSVSAGSRKTARYGCPARSTTPRACSPPGAP